MVKPSSLIANQVKTCNKHFEECLALCGELTQGQSVKVNFLLMNLLVFEDLCC